jgi:diguanylate cyclase (GGDEF)-like protein
MKKYIIYFSIAIALMNNMPTHAFDNVKFGKLSTKHGLSQSNVLCILQDSKGYMWFGTQNGLNVYNGYTFKVYTKNESKPDSLSNNVVHSLYEDTAGNLWVGTEGGGLNLFNRDTETFKHFSPEKNPGIVSHPIIKTVYEDQNHVLWIGTYGGGIDLFDTNSGSVTHFSHQKSNKQSLSCNLINVIYGDTKGNIWIGTEGNGLNKYDRKHNAFIRYPYKAIGMKENNHSKFLSGDTVNTIYEDRRGNIWIGTWGGGLNLLNPETNEFFCYLNDKNGFNNPEDKVVRGISEDKDGNIWVGFWNNGLIKLDYESGRIERYKHNPNRIESLGSDIIWTLYTDLSGILWIGTWGDGLNKYVWEDNLFFHAKHEAWETNSLNNNKVNCLFEDSKGLFWIGTLGGGLNRFDRTTGTYTFYMNDPQNPDSIPNNIVRTIYETKRGDLWIGTDGGLSRLDRDTETFFTFKKNDGYSNSLKDNRVYSLFEDEHEMLWIGYWHMGVSLFDANYNNFYHYDQQNNALSSNNVWVIFEDTRKNLWCGTTNGLNKMVRSHNNFKQYKHDIASDGSISNNGISDIFEDSEGRLWIGTLGGGLNQYIQKTDCFIAYKKVDGLPDNNIKGIQEDNKGNLWISTNFGISRFDPKNKKFQNFTTNDGLQNNEFSIGAVEKSKTGEIFFGGINGFNFFNPNNIEMNKYIPPVVLTSLKRRGENILENQSLDNLKLLTFSWKNNSFEFEYAALNYIQTEENNYAYRLEGFESNWNNMNTKRFGRYTNIPDGKYSLQIIASNNDGLWNESGYRLDIKVIPPFWRMTWFKITMVMLILLIFYAIYIIKTIRIQKRNQLLESLVKKRSKSLAEKNQELEQEIIERKKIEESLRRANDEIEKNNYKLKITMDKLQKMSRTDPLTKLPNRRHMTERIKEEINQYKKNQKPFSIVMTDIDHFKKFNDTYGHDCGDYVLNKVAEIIKESVRQEDFAARWGGEEFLMLLSGTISTQGKNLTEIIRKRIASTKFVFDGRPMSVTLTFGLANFDMDLGLDGTIQNADKALYIGKNQSRNCCVVYEEENDSYDQLG